ncbi:MAG: tetratricopeptide repeat protein [Gammaproteobacteria bacterium]|nr:tetratricopeptide repeat protein [Gammaproteobacteria bacterium]MBU0787761.1 tetratricopeptide repeat protein [Gammaproteobacteria bacterium]MBU0816216.1 tetratricopeptide repeat protein [Gammaproteobacteria bacterium]MBU1786123.1 tetratricopeptide repeat protein [Gammaproteobacteria bacterium]
MALSSDDLSGTQALVIDSNPTSRAILVTQLREFGVGRVAQSSRIADARRQLETQRYDVVLCEHYFQDSASSGQDLLDDLRRNQLLPFSTVFIMVTFEATYAKVAEAAESALDSYLLKPHRASSLEFRLRQARDRKVSLESIFEAIEVEDFEKAAELCLERFKTRGEYWLYAARIGAELLLRVGRHQEAQQLYQAVIDAQTLPWAKLGVARSMVESGQKANAVTMLEKMVSEDPQYSDAYDVLGRVHMELGNFEQARAVYKTANELTPTSISRLQNLATITFYAGDWEEAEKLLARTTRMGRDSKMFDTQTLVLLAFTRLENHHAKALQHCHDDLAQLAEKALDPARHARQTDIVNTLLLIQDSQFSRVVSTLRAMAQRVRDPEFDFESASNLLILIGLMSLKSIQLDEVTYLIDALGLRFCTSRPMSELLASGVAKQPEYAQRIRDCQVRISKATDDALTLSLRGDPTAAFDRLVESGEATRNAKLIETAYLVHQRYEAKIQDAPMRAETIGKLRTLYSTANLRQTVGAPARQAGGLVLRTSSRVTPERRTVPRPEPQTQLQPEVQPHPETDSDPA